MRSAQLLKLSKTAKSLTVTLVVGAGLCSLVTASFAKTSLTGKTLDCKGHSLVGLNPFIKTYTFVEFESAEIVLEKDRYIGDFNAVTYTIKGNSLELGYPLSITYDISDAEAPFADLKDCVSPGEGGGDTSQVCAPHAMHVACSFRNK